MATTSNNAMATKAHSRLLQFVALGTGPLLLGAGGVALYLGVVKPWSNVGIALMVAAASAAVGGLLGFLFGVPRSLEEAAKAGGPSETDGVNKPRIAVNTNLEQISDWLTKILIGVGLVQIVALRDNGARLVNAVAEPLGPGPGPRILMGALLLFTVIAGFLVGYVVTRTMLTQVFASFDPGLVRSIVDEKLTRNAQALQAYQEQVEDHTDVPFDKLRSAFAAASEGVLDQLIVLAQVRRRRASDSGDTQTLQRLEPVLRALAEVRPTNHRAWGNLGFALRDLGPDYDHEAIQALSRAIHERGAPGNTHKETYEFARALSMLRAGGYAVDAETGAAIRRDLEVAQRNPELARRISAALSAGDPDARQRELQLLGPFL